MNSSSRSRSSEPVLVAVLGDRHARHVLHHEVRPARRRWRRRRAPGRCSGWSISASACRSASKRAMTSSVSMPSLMTLRATRRRTGFVLLGEVDHAHTAFADQLQKPVGPDSFRSARCSRRALGRSVGIDGTSVRHGRLRTNVVAEASSRINHRAGCFQRSADRRDKRQFRVPGARLWSSHVPIYIHRLCQVEHAFHIMQLRDHTPGSRASAIDCSSAVSTTRACWRGG